MMALPVSLSLKSTVSTTTKSCQSTEANATATKKKKTNISYVACILLHKLQQMQDSSACIQLFKPVHNFHVTEEKLDISLIPDLKLTVCTCK